MPPRGEMDGPIYVILFSCEKSRVYPQIWIHTRDFSTPAGRGLDHSLSEYLHCNFCPKNYLVQKFFKTIEDLRIILTL
jgi:hypothetical protein